MSQIDQFAPPDPPPPPKGLDWIWLALVLNVVCWTIAFVALKQLQRACGCW